MFAVTDKRKLYWLIDQYLNNVLDADTFCDEYYDSFDLNIDSDTLTKEEHDAFWALSKIVHRFSPFEDDIKKYPGTYFTEEDLRAKIIATKDILINEFNQYISDQDGSKAEK